MKFKWTIEIRGKERKVDKQTVWSPSSPSSVIVDNKGLDQISETKNKFFFNISSVQKLGPWDILQTFRLHAVPSELVDLVTQDQHLALSPFPTRLACVTKAGGSNSEGTESSLGDLIL